MKDYAERLYNMFCGLNRAHGEFKIQGTSPTGKVQGRAKTVYTPVTPDVWEKHLLGEVGMGIVPINDDNSCRWGLLDIDVYNIDLFALDQRIHAMGLPLTVFKTKSGGAHLILFMSEYIEAKIIRDKLIDWSAQLGFAGCEVFPKQEKLVGKEDVGNWVNMPLFNGERSDRHIIHNNDSLSLKDTLDLCESRQVTLDKLIAMGDAPRGDIFQGMPPCLDILTKHGFPEGVRNDAMFSLGVYCKLRYADSWHKPLEDMNRMFMQPPLPATEVAAVIKSLDRKEYYYKCKQHPLKEHCNKNKCLGCEFGVGGNGQGADVQLTDLHKIMTEPPVWLLAVDGKRMRLSTQQLANQQQFSIRCMEALSIVPKTLKTSEWKNQLTTLMQEDNGYREIPMPDDITPVGLLADYLSEYCNSGSRRTDMRDHLNTGNKVWVNAGKAYFRGRGFLNFLERKNFKEMKTHSITAAMKTQLGCTACKKSINGTTTNLWYTEVKDTGEIAVPSIAEEEF